MRLTLQRLAYVVSMSLSHNHDQRAHDFTRAPVSFPNQMAVVIVWERDWMCACVQD